MDPTMMMLPKGQTLIDLYTEEEFKLIDSVLTERFGVGAAMLYRMKPAAVAAMLMMGGGEATANTTIDQYLWDRAKDAEITRRGVETLAEQMETLDSMPPRLLLEVITEEGSGDDELEMLVEAYKNEDLVMISTAVDSIASVESYMLTLNDNRNLRMVERLSPELMQGGVFVAVGAAHLAGSSGLIDLLRTNGFLVDPVLGGKAIQWLDILD